MNSPADPSKRRRAHHKSRKGCLECKRRHIKCDERRPTCANCDTSDRTCCYAVRPGIPPPRRDSPSDSSANSPIHGLASASDTVSTSASAPLESALPQALLQYTSHQDGGRFFTFQHLLLLHHVQNGMVDWLWVREPMRNMARAYINGALTSPFVMDQLLAISAQHVCTMHPNLRDQYRQLAIDLQTRALAGFKSATQDQPRRSLVSRFLFSSLMTIFAMADMAASSFDDVEHMLSRFVEFLNITRGVRIVGDAAWTELYESELGWIFSSFDNFEAYDDPLPASLSGAAHMLRRPGIDTDAGQICSGAARALGFLQKKLDSPTSWGVHVVMAWANLVDGAYTQLLADRKPEALVILAHYASILHRHREFWVFADLGKDLIEGIARSIAPEWLPYMTKPLEVLSTRPVNRVP